MSNSSLVQATILSPNHSGRRNQKITKIAIHHAAGVISGKNLARIFVPKSRQASANYNLGSDGVIVLVYLLIFLVLVILKLQNSPK